MNQNNQSKPAKISLLLADVDGTFVIKQKVLIDRAFCAVGKLHDVRIAFTITHLRSPMIVDALGLNAPIAAFNGAIEEEGFANAIERFILGNTAQVPAQSF